MAGVEPIVGLQAAWIVGLVAMICGDRPGMITGATGALAVVMPPLTRPCEVGCDVYVNGSGYDCHPETVENGCVTPQFAPPEKLGLLFYAVMLQGVLQLICGFFKFGDLVSLLPHPVMVGFCNGLAIIIGLAQFEGFKRGEMGPQHPLYCHTKLTELSSFNHADDMIPVSVNGTIVDMSIADCCSSDPPICGTTDYVDTGRRQLGGGTAIFSDGKPWHDGQTLLFMLIIIIPTMITVHFLPKLLEKLVGNGNIVPSSLVAIGLSVRSPSALSCPCCGCGC